MNILSLVPASGSPIAASSDEYTIGKAIRHYAGLQPDHVAVLSSGFEPLSYRELQHIIVDVRASLRHAGLGCRARIAIAIPDGPQAALAIVAVACSAVSIPLNPNQTLRELEICLATLRPDAILLLQGSDSIFRRAAKIRDIMLVEISRSKANSLLFTIVETKAPAATAFVEFDEPTPDAPAFILQTSGTTSEPKLIPFSHRNMLAAAARHKSWYDLTPRDRCLSLSPIYYSHGLKVTFLTPLLTGGSVAFPTDVSKFDYTEWFSNLGPTWYSAGPTLHRLILDLNSSPERMEMKIIRCALLRGGGAPLPRHVLDGLQSTLGVPVLEHYGSSEAALIASNGPRQGGSKPGTCGVPWPGTLIIVAEDGTRLAPGEQGEVLVGGPTLISGYLDAPELNQASFLDGWFKTGDVGSLDEDGFLTLHGRKTDVINRGGEKISPIEIDQALMRHPAVAEAAAFSVPHSRLGEDIAAAVVLRSHMTASPVELRRYLQEHLTPFKVPGRIVIRDQLPKGKTGKIVRRQLSASLEERTAIETQLVSAGLEKNTTADSILVEQLTDLWERLLQYSPLSPDDDFFEKGGDSLLAMEMLHEVAQLIGQPVPSLTLFEARTIRQLAQELVKLDARHRSFIQMNPNGNLAPLFFFHGDYKGGGLYAANLASLLGSAQPLFVIAPHDLDAERIPRLIEDMAAERLPLILKIQPRGPYRLCGYCLAGLVAFEVARLLIAAGERVEMVGMIDSPTVSGRRSVQFLLSAMRCARPIASSVVDRAVVRVSYICLQLDRPLNVLKSWMGKVFRWRTDDVPSSVIAMAAFMCAKHRLRCRSSTTRQNSVRKLGGE